jgi:hypothetical protein
MIGKPYKILVCGSRDIREYEFICSKMDFLISRRDKSSITIIHGAQKSFDKHLEINYGADYLAGQWCKSKNIRQIPFPADWDQHGKSAGPIRNSEMLKQEPNAFVAFFKKGSANRGTTDIVGKLKKAGVQGREYWC